MAQKGYTLEHTTMMINNMATNITNITIECKNFNLSRTFVTNSITTDMIDDMIEDDTIDIYNDLTFKTAVIERVSFYLTVLFVILFSVYSIYCLFMAWSFKVKARNVRRKREKRANRFQPPSYAELSRDYPSPPSFEDLSPPSFEDLQVDTELPEPEETPYNEFFKTPQEEYCMKAGCILFGAFVLLVMSLSMLAIITSAKDYPKEKLQDAQKNTPCLEFCWSFAVHTYALGLLLGA